MIETGSSKDFGSIFSLSYTTKGQIKPKADWRTIDSPKKRMNKFVLYFRIVKPKKIVRLVLGESTAHQSAYGFI